MTDRIDIALFFEGSLIAPTVSSARQIHDYQTHEKFIDDVIARNSHSAKSVIENKRILHVSIARKLSKDYPFTFVDQLSNTELHLPKKGSVSPHSDDTPIKIVRTLEPCAGSVGGHHQIKSRALKVVEVALQRLDENRAHERRPFVTAEMMVYLNSGTTLRMLELSTVGHEMICVVGEDEHGMEYEVVCGVDSFQYQVVFVQWPPPQLKIVK